MVFYFFVPILHQWMLLHVKLFCSVSSAEEDAADLSCKDAESSTVEEKNEVSCFFVAMFRE